MAIHIRIYRYIGTNSACYAGDDILNVHLLLIGQLPSSRISQKGARIALLARYSSSAILPIQAAMALLHGNNCTRSRVSKLSLIH